jgi:outer membrane lipoprotein carrier protein
MSNMVLAQQDPKAKEILDAMSNKYKSISSFQADLSYTMTNKTEGINESYKGKSAIKGDMYRLMMQDQEIYNDGTTIWTYLPNLDEPEVTIDNNNPDGGDITPSSIFNIYQEGYKYLYLNSTNIDGKSYDIVDLVPNDKDAQYFKVRIEISTKDNGITITAKDGKLTLAAREIEIKADDSLKIEATTIEETASDSMTTNAAKIEAMASGEMTLKGSTINLN